LKISFGKLEFSEHSKIFFIFLHKKKRFFENFSISKNNIICDKPPWYYGISIYFFPAKVKPAQAPQVEDGGSETFFHSIPIP
jgi:hypothetical protein